MKTQKLKKIVKPKTIQPILLKAQKVLGAGVGVAIVEGNTILAAVPESLCLVNDHQAGHLSWPDLTSSLTWPLAVSGAVQGHLIMGPVSLEETSGFNQNHAVALGDLIAVCLQEIIDREIARRSIAEETLDQYRESALMHRASMQLNRSLVLQEVTTTLLSECQNDALQTEMGIVFGFNSISMGYETLNSFGPIDDVGLQNIVKSPLFQEIARGKRSEIVNDLSTDERWHDDIPGIKSMLFIPLNSPGHWSGMLVLTSRKSSKGFSAGNLLRVSTIAAIAATAMANAHHFEEVRQMLNALMKALATAIDARDPCTSGHSQRVAEYALTFARIVNDDKELMPELSFSDDELNEIYYAAMLHDVGKIGVPEEVLTKSERLPRGHLDIVFLRMALWGELTGLPWEEDFEQIIHINKANVISEDDRELIHRLAASVVQIADKVKYLITEDEKERLLIPRGNLMPNEWDEIRKHSAESHRILSHIPFPAKFKHLLTIVRQHHEKLNGKGYPDQIHALEIILQSKLVTIVDIFDALTAKDRPYKRALPRHKALHILNEEAENDNLDKQLTALFIRHVDAIASHHDL
ncbi:MAG: HD domain-containing protein [Desulfamplus sp.]|nr:HD domain-containing protein [Desulfamplus sp.]